LRRSAREAALDYQAEIGRRELREEQIKGLMRELAHRAKNVLAVVQAIARETTPGGMASALSGRIASLACTHDLIAEKHWRGAHFRELVSRQVGYLQKGLDDLEPYLVTEFPQCFSDLPGGLWPEPSNTALVVPIPATGQVKPGFLISGLSPRRILDADYRSFLDLVAGHRTQNSRYGQSIRSLCQSSATSRAVS